MQNLKIGDTEFRDRMALKHGVQFSSAEFCLSSIDGFR